jgi:EAL domain-containing protein (putative c-di-GMP-specific phosphodiesterase class I)/GGDEF domain-containing protein
LTNSTDPGDTYYQSASGARLIDAYASTRHLRDRFLYFANKRYQRFLKDPRQPPHAVVCIRLNNWREYRDRFGFKVVGYLEDQFEERVLEALNERDFFLRISESSLIGLLTPGDDGLNADQWAKAMLSRLSDPPYRIGSRQITPTFSIGLCWFDRRVRDMEEALLDAIQLVEEFGDAESNQFRVFVPDVSPEEELGDEDSTAERIREALKTNRLRMVFQPLLAASSEDSRFYQAWPRLLSDTGRLIEAHHFLKVARRHDLLGPLQVWSIKRGLHFLVKIQEKAAHLRLFVNVSPEAFSDAFLKWLEGIFQRYPDAAPRLILEFEAFHLEHRVSDTLLAIERLRAMGVTLGVNSITRKHLKSRILDEVPVRFLRLGPELAHRLKDGGEGFDEFIEFVRHAHVHQRRVIVPEVSEAQQVINFWQSGVDLIQGDYIDTPATTISPVASA